MTTRAALTHLPPLALAAGLLLATPAAAYVRTPSPDHKSFPLWPDARVTMTLRTAGAQIVSPPDFRVAATRALATWSTPNVDTAVTFTIDASGDGPAGTRADGVNTISFRSDSWLEPMYPDGVLALTTVWSQGARIVDADTEINAVDPRFKWGLLPDDPVLAALASEVDLQNALTHELGHVLGLDHPCFLGDGPQVPPELDNLGQPVLSCADPALPDSVKNATMYPSSSPGSISERALSSDEVLALHDLYPARAAPGATNPMLSGRGGCAVADRRSGTWGAAFLMAALLARARRREPRRSSASRSRR
jgi:hypothetical protein